jgi:UTP--glucose-1-phosphate uridylyltransferase
MSDQRRPSKAVIPAAGLGTRFLPATKAVPKELLPVVDVPALEYIVAEAAGVGLTDILVITSRGKEAIADHFDRSPELESVLEKKGDEERLAAVRRPADLATMHFLRQGNPRGLGHAILCAEAFVGDEPFAVLLGDDIVDERDPLLQPMLDVQAEHGGCVVALMEVPRHSVSLYGCVAAEPTDRDGVVKVTDLVEKPSPEDAPSNLAIIGRYVLSPSIFGTLHETPPGRGNEIQITDALRQQVKDGEPMHGVVFRGRRYDTGDRADYLKAVVRLACERPDLGPDFRQWLEDFVAGRA